MPKRPETAGETTAPNRFGDTPARIPAWLPPRLTASLAGSARTGSPQVLRRVVCRGAFDRLVDLGFFRTQAHRDIAARLQVMVHLDRTEPHRDVVPDLAVLLGEAPQLAATVVLVDQHHRPAVFVDVEGALRIDMAGARLERALAHPNAGPFLAGPNLV